MYRKDEFSFITPVSWDGGNTKILFLDSNTNPIKAIRNPPDLVLILSERDWLEIEITNENSTDLNVALSPFSNMRDAENVWVASRESDSIYLNDIASTLYMRILCGNGNRKALIKKILCCFNPTA